MKETDISKVLIEGEYATIMGVKYKRVKEPKSPVEEAYKDWWGQYPELETDSEYDEMRWQGFQAGFQAAQSKNTEPYCPDEPEYYDEIEWDEKDNPNIQKIIDKMVEEQKSITLANIIAGCMLFHNNEIQVKLLEHILDRVEVEWLPKEQSAAGSQNVYVECSVEGFNDCLKKIKGMLR